MELVNTAEIYAAKSLNRDDNQATTWHYVSHPDTDLSIWQSGQPGHAWWWNLQGDAWLGNRCGPDCYVHPRPLSPAWLPRLWATVGRRADCHVHPWAERAGALGLRQVAEKVAHTARCATLVVRAPKQVVSKPVRPPETAT
jgi:hypothetical protein